MVTNPFYTGDFAPERLASIRMRKSGIPIGSFPVIEGHHPALVGRELVEEANEGLARNRYACPTKAEGRRPCRGEEIEEDGSKRRGGSCGARGQGVEVRRLRTAEL